MNIEPTFSTEGRLPEGGHTTLIGRRTRRRNLPGEIVAQLLDVIASHEPLEMRLPAERTLSEQLGVSRASLREALSALAELGVVDTRGKSKYARPSRARAVVV